MKKAKYRPNSYYRAKNRRKSWLKKLFLLLILLIILSSVYFLFFSSFFEIEAVDISGNKEITSDEIKDILKYKNIFSATENKIKNDLLKKFPQILELGVEKNLIKREIKIKLKEREEFGIVCQENTKKCFYIDKQGFIFEDAPQTSGSLILLIKDFSQREYSLGDQIFEEKIINSIYEIRENIFPETGIKILEFNIASFPVIELKAMTSEGWYILFDLGGDIKKQLTFLRAALQEKINDRKGLEYIDLRTKNRVYYK